MRALMCESLDGPASLRLHEDVAVPQVAPGSVLVRVAAAGVNFPDLLMTLGQYQFRPELPFAPGLEVAGEVLEVGDGVIAPDPGERVMAMVNSGGFAEVAVAPVSRVFPVSDALTDVEAAGFPLVYGTAYHALVDRARLEKGESLLVTGATGGVGMAAVQLGSRLGAEVTAVVSTGEKARLAAELGAHHVVVLGDGDLREQIRATHPGGVDVIYDPVGGDLFEPLARSLAWKGRLLVIGFAAGAIPSLPMNLPLLKGASIVGVFFGVFADREPDSNRANFERLEQMTEEGLRPHVSATYPLHRGAEALQAMAERRVLGKAVLEV